MRGTTRASDRWRSAPIRTQEEVGKMLGISRYSVDDIERRALRKIAEAIAQDAILARLVSEIREGVGC